MIKEYKIKHISDILEIPEDKFDHFLVDLKTVYEVSKNIREITLTLGDEASNKQFMPCVRWIDDDKHDGQFNITMSEAKK